MSIHFLVVDHAINQFLFAHHLDELFNRHRWTQNCSLKCGGWKGWMNSLNLQAYCKSRPWILIDPESWLVLWNRHHLRFVFVGKVSALTGWPVDQGVSFLVEDQGKKICIDSYIKFLLKTSNSWIYLERCLFSVIVELAFVAIWWP
jgi:hypothetical protein